LKFSGGKIPNMFASAGVQPRNVLSVLAARNARADGFEKTPNSLAFPSIIPRRSTGLCITRLGILLRLRAVPRAA
jgi:hypothetical protein